MNERREWLSELIGLSKVIGEREANNETTINGFFEGLEQLVRDEIRLTQPVWVEHGICEDSPLIFGWCQIAGSWHIGVGERETCPDPESGDPITYASSPKRILECDKSVRRQVFHKTQFLFGEIHAHLRTRDEETRKSERDIAHQIERVGELLKTEASQASL